MSTSPADNVNRTDRDTADRENSLSKREATLPEGVESLHAGREFLPRTDIHETEEHVVIVADLPGVPPGGIELNLERNLLTLRGRVERDQTESGRLAYSEYEVGDFVRTFKLSGEVDQERIEAKSGNGVLTLTLPKVGPVTRKIEITPG